MRASNLQKRPRRHQTGRGGPFSLPGAGRRTLRRRTPARGARPVRTAPAAAAQVTGLTPSGARGRLSGRQAARLPALTAGVTSLPA